MHLYTALSTLASKVVYNSNSQHGTHPTLGVSHHLEVIGSASSPHWHLMPSYPMFAGYSFYLPTKGWRDESTLARYQTQDPWHEGLLL